MLIPHLDREFRHNGSGYLKVQNKIDEKKKTNGSDMHILGKSESRSIIYKAFY